MRSLIKCLALAVVAGGFWLLGGCSNSYDPYYYGHYDNGYYYRDRPVAYYYYHSNDPYYFRHRPYYHRYEDRHNDSIRIHGDVHVRDW